MKYALALMFVISTNVFAKLAVSLSYDDALTSQLDNALPTLNKHELKASFYIVPNSPTFQSRLNEWRAIAKQGHELGNHTLFHSCRASKPHREWVEPHYDLDTKSMAEIVNEVKVANAFLHAIDGKTERTFTPPCFDVMVEGKNYLNQVRDLFIAIKGQEPPEFSALFVPNGNSAQEIIEFIEKQPKHIKLVNILMHGVGGDHLMISAKEHENLVSYLANNRNRFWVDTYLNIMKKLKPQ